MKYLLLIMSLSFSVAALSQADTTTYGYVNGTILETEISPAYPGGEMSWKRFLNINMKRQDTSGVVTVAFTVSADGKTSGYEIIKSVTPDLDNEAIRLIKKSGFWTPAVLNGKHVKYRNREEIEFP